MKRCILILSILIFSSSCNYTKNKKPVVTSKVKSKSSEIIAPSVLKDSKQKIKFGKKIFIYGALNRDGSMDYVRSFRPIKSERKVEKVDNPVGNFIFIILSKEKKVLHSYNRSIQFGSKVCVGSDCSRNLSFKHYPLSIGFNSSDNEFYLKVLLDNKVSFTSELVKVKNCEDKFIKCFKNELKF